MGLGMLVKAVIPSWFSITAFGYSQILIDLEPLYYMITDDPPLHRFFHTYIGALVVGLIAFISCSKVCEPLLKFWNSRLSETQAKWLAVKTDISMSVAFVSCMVGTLSHIALDSFVHGDIQPLSPFQENNPLAHVVSVNQMYLACIIAGMCGLLIYGVYEVMRRKNHRSNSAG